MTAEQNFLQSWTPDYANEKGEQFYESGKVAIILSEYSQIKNRGIKAQFLKTEEDEKRASRLFKIFTKKPRQQKKKSILDWLLPICICR